MNIIFCLHDEPSPDLFENKIKWLTSHYKMVSYDELKQYLEGRHTMNKCCHLTFDDGWLSTYQVVFPIIKKYNVPITVFTSPELCKNGTNLWFERIDAFDKEAFKRFIINKNLFHEGASRFPVELLLKSLEIKHITNLIDEYSLQTGVADTSRNFINANELLEMNSSPLVTIGAHTMNHPILANETDEISRKEITDSVEGLQELIQKEVDFFAYPNGIKGLDFGKREEMVLSQCGIKYAVSLENGFVHNNSVKLELPRFTSFRRLSFGLMAPFIPSPANQKGKRLQIKKLMIND